MLLPGPYREVFQGAASLVEPEFGTRVFRACGVADFDDQLRRSRGIVPLDSCLPANSGIDLQGKIRLRGTVFGHQPDSRNSSLTAIRCEHIAGQPTA